MSKIQSLASDYRERQNLSPNFKKQNVKSQHLSFTAESIPGEIVKEVTGAVSKQIDEKLGWIGKKFIGLAENDGEAQNQLINAIFTTTLAPIMIAFNPFSKQDKKTKEYSAMRQPISAGIAISGGLAMTMGVNSYLSKLASEGYIENIDLRLKPDDKIYLKSKFKKDNNIWLFMNKEEKAKFKEEAKKIQEARIKLFAKLFGEKPENIKINKNTKEIYLASNPTEILGKNIPGFNEQEDLNNYTNNNSLRKIKVKNFLREKFGFEFDADGILKPNITDNKLSNILASDFLHEMGIIKKGSIDKETFIQNLAEIRQEEKTIKEIHKLLSENNGKNIQDEIVKTLKEELNLPEEKAKEFAQKFEIGETKVKDFVRSIMKEVSRIVQTSGGETHSKADTLTIGQFFGRIGIKNKPLTKEELKADYKELQTIMDMDMIQAIEFLNKKFSGKVKGFEIGEEKQAKLLEKAVLLITENKAKLKSSNYGNFNKYVNLVLNLPMTAITCYVLNWAYPRIMDKYFPNLSKNTQLKGGNK